jgi:hypothetical protein
MAYSVFACLIVTFSSSFFTGKDFKIQVIILKENVAKCILLSMSYFVSDSYSQQLSNNDVML